LRDNRRTPVLYRGKKVAGLFQRQRSTGLVYEARVRVNGELHRETFDQATTTAEAVQALDAFKTALRNGHPSAQSRRNGLTLADAFAVYIERLERDGAATTLSNVSYRWRHLSDLHSRPLASVSRGDVADLVRSLRKRGMAGSSIRSVWALGSAVFSVAIEHEFDGITVNPFALVKKLLPPQNRGAKRELTPDLVHTLLDVATERQAPLLALLGLQGLRISEARGVVWSDIDLDQSTLHVQAQLAPDGTRTPLLKTEGSERVLKLDGRTISTLRSWKAKQMTLGLHRPDDFVLATQTGRPTKRRQAHRTLQGVARQARLIGPGETFRPHDLRSGFACAALLAGDPPNLVQRMLGHSTSQMTMDLYGKLKGQEAVGTAAFAQPEAEIVPLKAVGS
jgi:integrase